MTYQNTVILSNRKFLVLVVGPTAVGKTELCLKLAKKFKTEIVSCDSRQFYKEMKLGTAKPSTSELSEVRHHFIDSLSIFEAYDVRKFEKDALGLLENLFQENEVVILTGGSGLFADIVVKGMDEIPDIDPEIRKSILTEYDQNGLQWLQNEVGQIDPDYFEKVDRQNPQRLMRALEIYRGTGLKFSAFRKNKKAQRPFEVIKIGLNRDRDDLYRRIDQRMDAMIEQGLFEEAKSLFPHRHLNALQTVGYSEIFDFLEGKYGQEEAVRLLKRNSRRYAKRQLTWFRRDEEIHWFYPEDQEAIIQLIKAQMGLNPPIAATQL